MRTPYSLIYSTHNGDDAPKNFYRCCLGKWNSVGWL